MGASMYPSSLLLLSLQHWCLKDAKNRVHLGMHGGPHMAASGLLHHVTSVSYKLSSAEEDRFGGGLI